MSYVGRFAPSPTGSLHLGSLTTAVASFLHARQRGGEWLVRIEDIDPPREVAGAAAEILRTLEAFGLHWDREVLYQSTRFDRYRETAEELLASGLAFRCSCSRKDVLDASPGGRYPGTCRARRRHSGATAVRVRVDPGEIIFADALQGPVSRDLGRAEGDYLIYRRDALPAYHLAVVCDDFDQGVDTIVRGIDLLDPTSVHWHLQRTLALPHPRYLHIPVLVNAAGQKLSKQTGAAAVDRRSAAEIAQFVLTYLGLSVPAELKGARPATLWAWALPRWEITELKGVRSINIT
jgi:glutamyl-Q tRNA(Asp) synthetase